MKDDLQKASIDDLREMYGDYPVWAAIQRAYEIGHAKAFGLSKAMTKSDCNIGYVDGFVDAAEDPSAWFVRDHGESFRLGDKVWFRDFEQEINGFVCADDTTISIRLNVSGLVDPSEISHNKPIDTWEKLQAEIVGTVFISENKAADFITRAKKLGGCDE